MGETGGKDFVVAHPSADLDAADRRRSSAAPSSTRARSARRPRAPTCRALWDGGLGERARADVAGSLRYGDVADFTNFLGAVIDASGFDKLAGVLDRARRTPPLSALAGGGADDSEGSFVGPP